MVGWHFHRLYLSCWTVAGTYPAVVAVVKGPSRPCPLVHSSRGQEQEMGLELESLSLKRQGCQLPHASNPGTERAPRKSASSRHSTSAVFKGHHPVKMSIPFRCPRRCEDCVDAAAHSERTSQCPCSCSEYVIEQPPLVPTAPNDEMPTAPTQRIPKILVHVS